LKVTIVVADARLSFALNCVILYAIGTPTRLTCAGSEKRPKIYSRFNSSPSKVRVMSTRPWTYSCISVLVFAVCGHIG
jgi:hypothetical protein